MNAERSRDRQRRLIRLSIGQDDRDPRVSLRERPRSVLLGESVGSHLVEGHVSVGAAPIEPNRVDGSQHVGLGRIGSEVELAPDVRAKYARKGNIQLDWKRYINKSFDTKR